MAIQIKKSKLHSLLHGNCRIHHNSFHKAVSQYSHVSIATTSTRTVATVVLLLLVLYNSGLTVFPLSQQYPLRPSFNHLYACMQMYSFYFCKFASHLFYFLSTHLLFLLYQPIQPSQKTFRTKRTLAKKQRQNRPLPQWIRLRTDNTIKYNAKRRHWRRTKLGL
jgi:Ribosomal protein L39E